jgi:hypothetical protein
LPPSILHCATPSIIWVALSLVVRKPIRPVGVVWPGGSENSADVLSQHRERKLAGIDLARMIN